MLSLADLKRHAPASFTMSLLHVVILLSNMCQLILSLHNLTQKDDKSE